MIDETAESFMSARAGGLGGTDMAAIVGLSPWKSPIDIYLGKLNPQDVQEPEKECMFWGSALEPIIRDRYAMRFGVDVVAPSKIAELYPRHKPWGTQAIVIGDEPWMFGTPDGIMPAQNSGLEIKCSAYKSGEWGAEGTDEIPAHYLIQAMWYMAVTGLPAWNFAVLFSGNKLASYRVEVNPELVKTLRDAARAFWNDCIVKQVPPPVDASASYGRYLARKFSVGTGNLIEPTPEIDAWATTLCTAQLNIADMEAQIQLAKNHLAELIGEADGVKATVGKIGWVRPKAEGNRTDYREALSDVCTLVAKSKQKQIQKIISAHTTATKATPYIRAWPKKEEKNV